MRGIRKIVVTEKDRQTLKNFLDVCELFEFEEDTYAMVDLLSEMVDKKAEFNGVTIEYTE